MNADDHADRVLTLADRLRAEGIDVTLDQYEIAPPEGWPTWMERQVRQSDFVLVVCTEIYLRRAERREKPGAGHGVTFESSLSLQHLYDAGMWNTRFIPVVFEDRDIAHIPTPLRGANRYNIGTKNGYERLYRHLTGQAETPAPDIGQRRRLPPRERQWRSPPQVADTELQKERSPDLERQNATALSEKDFSAERIHTTDTGDLVVFRVKLGHSAHRLEWVYHHVWFGANTVNIVLDDKVVLKQNAPFDPNERHSASYQFQTYIDNQLLTFVIYERLGFWNSRSRFTISVNDRITLQE